jgi:AcrR family transcriptional regulator
LEEISIKEICDKANISEGTFFNYFPKKQDVIKYFISNWSIDVSWHAQTVLNKTGSSIKAIETVYSRTAEQVQDNVPVIFEIIALIARTRKMIDIEDISLAEKLIAFPELKEIDKIKANNLVGVFKPLIEQAIEKEELPVDTDIEALLLALRAIFFGTTTAVTQNHANKLNDAYQYHLNILWKYLK